MSLPIAGACSEAQLFLIGYTAVGLILARGDSLPDWIKSQTRLLD